MPIIREQVLLTGKNISGITITLSSNDGFVGYQQEINNLTQATMLDLVNPAVDIEKRKFVFNVSTLWNMFRFSFNNLALFTAAGFTQYEITGQTSNILNSFFILDYYDSYDPNTQIKIFTTYLTKIGKTPEYFTGIDPTTGRLTTNQFYYWYVPQSYVDAQTGTTAIGYVKFSFYNAKSGTTTTFYNAVNDNTLLASTPQKLYFKAKLNLVNKTWEFLDLNGATVDARNLVLSSAYNARVDNTFAKYNNTKQLYPSGSTYNYKTNKYITPSGSTVI